MIELPLDGISSFIDGLGGQIIDVSWRQEYSLFLLLYLIEDIHGCPYAGIMDMNSIRSIGSLYITSIRTKSIYMLGQGTLMCTVPGSRGNVLELSIFTEHMSDDLGPFDTYVVNLINRKNAYSKLSLYLSSITNVFGIENHISDLEDIAHTILKEIKDMEDNYPHEFRYVYDSTTP